MASSTETDFIRSRRDGMTTRRRSSSSSQSTRTTTNRALRLSASDARRSIHSRSFGVSTTCVKMNDQSTGDSVSTVCATAARTALHGLPNLRGQRRHAILGDEPEDRVAHVVIVDNPNHATARCQERLERAGDGVLARTGQPYQKVDTALVGVRCSHTRILPGRGQAVRQIWRGWTSAGVRVACRPRLWALLSAIRFSSTMRSRFLGSRRLGRWVLPASVQCCWCRRGRQ